MSHAKKGKPSFIRKEQLLAQLQIYQLNLLALSRIVVVITFALRGLARLLQGKKKKKRGP